MTLKEMVKNCLEKYPTTRNSDIQLTNAVWVEYYPNLLFIDENREYCVKLLDIYKLPTNDNVKRWRCKFNEAGLYEATDQEVIKQRQRKEEIFRSQLGYNPELRTV